MKLNNILILLFSNDLNLFAVRKFERKTKLSYVIFFLIKKNQLKVISIKALINDYRLKKKKKKLILTYTVKFHS